MKSKVSVLKCGDYVAGNVQATVKKGVDLIGGISSFIKDGSRVLLKPNLLMAASAESAIDTHPEIVRAVIKLLKKANAEIFIGDCPSVWGKQEDINEVYRVSGIASVAEEEGVELVELKGKVFKKGLALASFLDEVDAVVSIPKFKTHDLTTLTAAVKNLFGLIPGLFKTELHKKHFKVNEFSKMLVDIYDIVRPALTIVDAIDAMEGDGPARGGKLRHVGLVLAGTDAIAIDSILARIMNIRPKDVHTIEQAQMRGLGNSEMGSIDILGEKLEDIIIPDFKLPQPSIVRRIPKPIFDILKGLINYRPVINTGLCTKCKKCSELCPTKVIDIDRKEKIDYSNCIKCFCCMEVCPEGAISIRKSLVAKLLGLRR